MATKFLSTILLTVAFLFAMTMATVHQKAATSALDLLLSARNLPNNENNFLDGRPEGYVKLFYRSNDFESYAYAGETNYISDNNNPDWPEIFRFNADPNQQQQSLKFEVYDQDWEADDYIGFLEIRLADVVNAFNNRVERDLIPAGRGKLIIQGRVGQKPGLDARFTKKTSKIIGVPTVERSRSDLPTVATMTGHVSPRFLNVHKNNL